LSYSALFHLAIVPKPTMSNRNSVLSQKLYHYLNADRTLNDLLWS